jgi:hypothetical protein
VDDDFERGVERPCALPADMGDHEDMFAEGEAELGPGTAGPESSGTT